MSLLKSIATVSGYTAISRITGFVRDVITANALGAGFLSDCFFVAFKFPNLFRNLFGEGAFQAAFVPMYAGELEEKGKEKARIFGNDVLAIMIYILSAFVIIMELLMPWAIYLFAPGFADVPSKMETAAELSRITFPFLMFISISCLQAGVLNSYGKFAAGAATPIILNISMIAAIFLLKDVTKNVAEAISWGVFAAGILQIFWLYYFTVINKINLVPSMISVFKKTITPEVKTFFKRMIPGIFGAGVYQINLLVDTILVSLTVEGAVSWLYYATRIYQLPLGVVGAAVGTALLPMLAKKARMGKKAEANLMQNKSVEFSMLVTIPAFVAMVILAYPIINVLFEHGKFNAQDTDATAKALMILALGLPAYVLTKIFAPAFFAIGDTKTPVKIATFSLVSNVVLNIIFMIKWGYLGITLGTTLSAWGGAIIYMVLLKRKDMLGFTPKLLGKIKRMFVAAIIMGIILQMALFYLKIYLPDWNAGSFALKFSIFLGLVILGALVFFILAWLFNTFSIGRLKNAK